MNELNKIAQQVVRSKYKEGEEKLLLTLYKQEIIKNEVETLLNMGWETSRTSSQQPIEVINYIYNNK